MLFRFSLRVTIICLFLVLAMLRASYWQYQRHLQKMEYIKVIEARVKAPLTPLTDVLASISNPEVASAWADFEYRRVSVSGSYDYTNEMLLKNRRLENFPGNYTLTPLKIDGTNFVVIVSRGFIPLPNSPRDTRKIYQKALAENFTGLIKASAVQRLFAPADAPTGPQYPWVDSWLRVDLPKMRKQLPYAILPVYLELMESSVVTGIEEKIVSARSSREEMFFLPGQENAIPAPDAIPKLNYPVPVFDTVAPPGRHKGYVYEWAIMALITTLIGIVLQLKRPARAKT